MSDRTAFTSQGGGVADTLNLFGELLSEDGFMIVLSDEGSPQVLPAVDDGFVLTSKFADEAPAPSRDEVDPWVLPGALGTAQELTKAPALDMTDYFLSGGLTLIDEWSGIVPSKHQDWGLAQACICCDVKAARALRYSSISSVRLCGAIDTHCESCRRARGGRAGKKVDHRDRM